MDLDSSGGDWRWRPGSWITQQYVYFNEDNRVNLITKYYLALWIQWCHARAQELRWSEEVDLFVEEM